ncbi:MAG: Fur family transcriptional regulator [Candidatus Omnitrophica bacterium]|nr:Fur family transcriptional regulator [Candidatus Omnitrophota bacterium]
MKECIRLLKEKGVKITAQRIAVFELLRKNREHLTVERIFEEVKRKFPAVSLGTIYAVLFVLRHKGLVSEVRIVPDKASFEARTDVHHHFYCTKCERVSDIAMPFCQTIERREIEGNIIEECHGYFYGVCKQCRKKNA